jgi:hypothetical protein
VLCSTIPTRRTEEERDAAREQERREREAETAQIDALDEKAVDEHAKFAREVYDTYRSEGIGPAMGKFAAGTGLDQDQPWPVDPTPEIAEAMARMQGNLDFFLGHMWLPLGDYAPDISRLRSPLITVAVGEASEGQLAHRAAVTLAEQLGKEPTVFPGGHSGTITQPEAYAGCLHEVLSTY